MISLKEIVAAVAAAIIETTPWHNHFRIPHGTEPVLQYLSDVLLEWSGEDAIETDLNELERIVWQVTLSRHPTVKSWTEWYSDNPLSYFTGQEMPRMDLQALRLNILRRLRWMLEQTETTAVVDSQNNARLNPDFRRRG